MDTISLLEYATEVDAETVVGIDHLSIDDPRTTDVQRCAHCNKKHIPRRLVYCVDGTWMVEDGPEGYFEKNPSNIFRVFLAVKEGRVVDKDGKVWEQRKRYYKGLGARQPKWKKYWQGGSGDGYEELIAEVYEHCAKACCPSQDELFLFGYSRGAFIVRAVAGLFNHLGTVKRGVEDWDDKLAEAIDLYKKRREEGDNSSQPHSDFHFLSRHTTDSPRIKFLGLFDTVKSVGILDPEGAFGWLNKAVTKRLFESYHYDIRQTPNTDHVRHALALLENRDSFKPERVENEQEEKLPANNARRTCLEAWFLGFHADMGGGSKEDGLSLWPLQWILSEAARYGLFLEFHAPERLIEDIEDPLQYAFPKDQGPHQIPFKNGATVDMWDLNEEFNRANLKPAANEPSGLTARLSTSERQIVTDDETASATIIHPSVFWADDVTPLGIRFLSPLNCSNKIRQAIKDINIRPESLYWNQYHTRVVDLERSRPRVLICGPSGVGKSSLVNKVLDEEVSPENSGLTSVQHEIDAELTAEAENSNNFTFHDANGFERGLEETLRRVHSFIEKRQKSTTFEEQLHCIWYCCSSISRIEEADREFIRSTSSCGIPIIVVFTKYDVLRMDCLREACRQFRRDHPAQPSFRYDRIPVDIKNDVESRQDFILVSRCQERRNLVRELSTGQCEHCFVSIEEEDTIQELCEKTQACLKDEILLGIHDRAMMCYLEQALPQVTRQFTESIKQRREEIGGWGWNTLDWMRFVQDRQKDLVISLPPLYRLDMAATLNITDTHELFSELYPTDGAPGWWKTHVSGRVLVTTSAMLGNLVTLTAFFTSASVMIPAFGLILATTPIASTAYIEIRTSAIPPGVYSELAAQAACAILMHEKLFWLGIKDIRSTKILALAAIEVIKQSEEMVRFLTRVRINNSTEFEETLRKLVVEMRTNLRIVET